jgi:hypothetical protein
MHLPSPPPPTPTPPPPSPPQFRARNITNDDVSMIFLHDDDSSVGGDTAAAADYLHTNAPDFAPQVNQFPDSGCVCE